MSTEMIGTVIFVGVMVGVGAIFLLTLGIVDKIRNWRQSRQKKMSLGDKLTVYRIRDFTRRR